jgi:hypothetical protein
VAEIGASLDGVKVLAALLLSTILTLAAQSQVVTQSIVVFASGAIVGAFLIILADAYSAARRRRSG